MKFVYGTVREHPRKVIHVVRVLDELLDTDELSEIAERMRAQALIKSGEQDAAVVVVQGNSKATLRLFGETYAVTRVRTAMFNAAISWREIDLN
jgi:hypothetical protein